MMERPILFSAPMVRAILDGRKTQTRRPLDLSRAVGDPGVPTGHVLDLIYPGSVQHYGYVTAAHDRTAWRVQRLCDASCAHPDDTGPYDGRHSRSWGPMPYAPGQRLWVRETHAQFAVGNRTGLSPQCVAYRATCDDDGGFRYVNNGDEIMRLKVTKWTPAIHMPRWASRITLEVTEIRVQRLQDISEEDARDEGVEPYTPPHGRISPDQSVPGPGFDGCRLGDQPHRLSFADVWDSIYGRPRPVLDDDGERVLHDDGRPVMEASRSWASNPWVRAETFRRLP